MAQSLAIHNWVFLLSPSSYFQNLGEDIIHAFIQSMQIIILNSYMVPGL